MKISKNSPSKNRGLTLPNLCNRPRRIRLEEITAVRGFGKLRIRPIQPEDEEEMIHFHESISEESIYLRYFQYLGLDRRTSHERLVKICTNSADSYAVVLERDGGKKKLPSILGIGRLTKTQNPWQVTFDTLLSDAAQDPRLAKLLLNRLLKIARAFGYESLIADLLIVDHDMLNLCRTLDFTLQPLADEGVLRAQIGL